jgi:hypothetical protein
MLIMFDNLTFPIAYTLYIIGQGSNTFNVCLQAANISLTEYEFSTKHVPELQSKLVSVSSATRSFLFQWVVL